MATKKYNQHDFDACVNERDYNFHCYTTNTRSGFCHTVQIWVDWKNVISDTKISYFNRTWERFDYETALKRAIDKCRKEDRDELYAILIEQKAQDEHEKAEKFFNAFKSEYDNLSDKNKEILKNSPQIVSEEQAEGVMKVMKIMNAFDELGI